LTSATLVRIEMRWGQLGDSNSGLIPDNLMVQIMVYGNCIVTAARSVRTKIGVTAAIHCGVGGCGRSAFIIPLVTKLTTELY
jgi:hypothetical protein